MVLTVEMFWNVTLCHWVFWNMWKERSAFICRVKLSKALHPSDCWVQLLDTVSHPRRL